MFVSCYRTLEERAQRLFETKGKKLSDLDPNVFAKSKPGKAGRHKDMEKQKEIAILESQLYRLVEIVSVRDFYVIFYLILLEHD